MDISKMLQIVRNITFVMREDLTEDRVQVEIILMLMQKNVNQAMENAEFYEFKLN